MKRKNKSKQSNPKKKVALFCKKTNIYSSYIKSVIFSFYNDKFLLKIIALNKAMQSIMGISLEDYKFIFSVNSTTFKNENVSAFFSYYYMKFSGIKQSKINKFLIDKLKKLSEKEKIEINNIDYFSGLILNNIPKNITLNIVSINHHYAPLNIMKRNNIETVNVKIKNLSDQMLETLFTKIIPKNIKNLCFAEIVDERQEKIVLKYLKYFYNLQKIENFHFLCFDDINNLDCIKEINLKSINLDIIDPRNDNRIEIKNFFANKKFKFRQLSLFFPLYKPLFDYMKLFSKVTKTIKELTISNASIQKSIQFQKFQALKIVNLINCSMVKHEHSFKGVNSLKQLNLTNVEITLPILNEILKSNLLLEKIVLVFSIFEEDNFEKNIKKIGKTLSSLTFLKEIKLYLLYYDQNITPILYDNFSSKSLSKLDVNTTKPYFQLLNKFPQLEELIYKFFCNKNSLLEDWLESEKEEVKYKQQFKNKYDFKSLYFIYSSITSITMNKFIFSSQNLHSLIITNCVIDIHSLIFLLKNFHVFKNVKIITLLFLYVYYQYIPNFVQMLNTFYLSLSKCSFLEAFHCRVNHQNAFSIATVLKPPVNFPFLKEISIAHYEFFKLFMKKLFNSNSLYVVHSSKEYSFIYKLNETINE